MGIQVSSLTQDKKPWQKEFIDFQFDGKYISEFGLVAVSDGDRHTFAASSDFEDETTQVNGYNGQHFWGTNLKARKFTYSLATDGMTEEQLNAFKRHFQPGKYGKFIESHLHYRYSYCRLAEVVEFKLIPFQVKKSLLGQDIYINEYKGEAHITFVQDDPYFYSDKNYVEEINPETVRAIYTNGIPIPQSWVISTGMTDNSGQLDIAKLNIMLLDAKGETLDMPSCHLGSDRMLKKSGESGILALDKGHSGIAPMACYNPSTVDTATKITMTFGPSFTPVNTDNEAWRPVYYNQIADDINSTEYNHLKPWNSIQSSILKKVIVTEGNKVISIPNELEYSHEFKYTSPSMLRSINRTIQIVWQRFNKSNTVSFSQLEELLRSEITHEEVLSWAMSSLAIIKNHQTNGVPTFLNANGILDKNARFTGTIFLNHFGIGATKTLTSTSWFTYFNILMLLFLGGNKRCDILPENMSEPGYYPQFETIVITFDGEKSETFIKYSHYSRINNKVEKIYDKEERCGDMILSEYLVLDGGDTINEIGETKSCHFICFFIGGKKQDVNKAKLEYNYTYV